MFTVIRSLFHELLDGQSQEVVKTLQKENVAPSSIAKVRSLMRADDIVADIFSGLESTHLRKKYVSENFAYTEVTEVPLQTGNCADSVCYIPVQSLLTNLLQSEEMLECIMQPPSSSPHMLSDVFDGDFFRQHQELSTDSSHDTIFLLVYTDELEITNPLGSAAGKHKVLAVYFSILNLHPRHRSKLSAIHLLLLAPYMAVERHGLDKVLAPLVDGLNSVKKTELMPKIYILL